MSKITIKVDIHILRKSFRRIIVRLELLIAHKLKLKYINKKTKKVGGIERFEFR